ncbi:transcription factor castor-like isoform X2 [Lytechinus variegatus]|nr:transcription factor castor-like isoform X2 [Lytechinus variegatus]XP_041468253.1 transcription factor castor-like isoform X2 [Lytechinus variegatus]XP_041468254.1 transcription factor castor-like isoform X2 [Lytechinus variegatus]
MATGSHLAVNLQELEMLKREMPQQIPAGVQRSTSLDSMPPPAQPAPVANNTDRLQQQPQQSLAGIPELHNSLSSPPQACPVQRSRSLPLLDASQEIPAEILAQLTERENEQMVVTDVGQHALQRQQQQQQQDAQEPQPAPQQPLQQHNLNSRISDSTSTCNSISISNIVSNSSNVNNVPFSDYMQASQYRLLTQSQLQQATHLQENSQPLNLSQTAEVRQILSQGLPSHIPRVANFGGRHVQVGRDDLPLDWSNFQQAARYGIRPSEPRLGFPPAMLPPAIGQMPPTFNPAFSGRGIDSYGVGASAEGIRYSVPSAMNPNLQKPHMPLSVFARQHAFIKEEVGRQSPKDATRLLHVPMDHVENNNDKSSPNIQAMSDGSTSNIAEKNMMPLSVSVSVAFSEPSQDSPSFSQQSNSPALLKPAADQTLSMINYHEDHLLSDTGLMSNSPVPSSLDENFLNSNMIISTNSAARLSDATNLTGLDSNPPSVKMEGFDLFEGSGDVDEQNYITDSISPQSLSMEDSNQGLPHGIQQSHGNPRPLSQSSMSAAHARGKQK